MKFDKWAFIFPRRCPICHEVVEDMGQLACDICRTRLSFVREPSCRKCGKPLILEEEEYCRDCIRKKHGYRQAKAPFVYGRVMQRSIAEFKYHGRREYAAFYAEEILRKCAGEMMLWNAEALIPIPLHSSRKRKRGFNQAELLAKELSRRAGIPVDSRLLFRVKKTRAQKDLNDQERLENLKNAFSVRKRKNPYKNVILVDDIYTTGSTVDAAAEELKKQGVQNVYVLCICVGGGYS